MLVFRNARNVLLTLRSYVKVYNGTARGKLNEKIIFDGEKDKFKFE